MAKVKSYSVPDNEISGFEKLLGDIGRIDRWSDSQIILEAVKEYAKRHLPGNPQLPITNFNGQEEFSISAQEKLVVKPEFQQMKVVPCPQCDGSGVNPFGLDCGHCGGKRTITEWT